MQTSWNDVPLWYYDLLKIFNSRLSCSKPGIQRGTSVSTEQASCVVNSSMKLTKRIVM